MRRGNGYGSITKIKGRKLRKPFRVSVSTGERDAKGNYKREVLDYFATRTEAEAFLARYMRRPIDKYNIILEDLYELWYDRRKRLMEDGKLSRQTLDGNRAAWKRFAPLAKQKVRTISTEQMQEILDTCELSRSSVEKMRCLAVMLWDYAMEQNIVDRNYASYLIVSTAPSQRRDRFSQIELEQIKKAAAKAVPWADCILMLCYTGFRLDEFLSLTKFNVTWTEQGKILSLCGGNKTAAGKNRIVPVPDLVEPYFQAWYKRNPHSEYIISKPMEGPSRGKSKYNKDWWRDNCYYAAIDAINADGQKIRRLPPHSCRHTFASLCEDAGISQTKICQIIGHESYKTTKKYTHPDINELKNAVNLLK